MEEVAKQITINISHVVEILAAVIIAVAVIIALYNYLLQLLRKRNPPSLESIRVNFGSTVAVALELLLGADVLATAVAPGWDAIGMLAAIAVLRTALNYFLAKELKEIKEHVS
ncbi:DUF1622 domain-containing protein [Lacibacter sp. MH-610]|uniref:DUF1622 domain-containing protein n=1 Tax=Lacibacter sp. MH-610 TaxID=3020883 RepID=UPI0038929A3E